MDVRIAHDPLPGCLKHYRMKRKAVAPLRRGHIEFVFAVRTSVEALIHEGVSQGLHRLVQRKCNARGFFVDSRAYDADEKERDPHVCDLATKLQDAAAKTRHCLFQIDENR